jgi:hypothetical protein
MFDEYSLRLLAEIGIDVYLPRAERDPIAAPVAVEPGVAAPANRHDLAGSMPASADAAAAVVAADVLILCAGREPAKLLADLLRALRAANLIGALGDIDDVEAAAAARGLVVLGESLARQLGAGLSAQRQNAIAWVVAIEPAALSRSADAKRALWGEIKRLSRTLAIAQPVG